MKRHAVKHQKMHPSWSHGQALTETLVSLLALVPLFIIVPYIGKYLDVKHKVADATRYSVWERTIWSDPGAELGSGENSKSDADIALELNDRILSDPRSLVRSPTRFTQADVSDNPLWVDYVAEPLVALRAYQPAATGSVVSEAALNEEQEPIEYGPSTALVAFGGIPFSGALGLSDELGLGVNERGFAASGITVPLVPLPDFKFSGVAVDIQRPTQADAPINMAQTAAALTDGWMPGSENNFRDRLDGLVTDEPLQLIVNPGTFTFGVFPAFIEGLDGQNPQLESETEVIPFTYLNLLEPKP